MSATADVGNVRGGQHIVILWLLCTEYCVVSYCGSLRDSHPWTGLSMPEEESYYNLITLSKC